MKLFKFIFFVIISFYCSVMLSQDQEIANNDQKQITVSVNRPDEIFKAIRTALFSFIYLYSAVYVFAYLRLNFEDEASFPVAFFSSAFDIIFILGLADLCYSKYDSLKPILKKILNGYTYVYLEKDKIDKRET